MKKVHRRSKRLQKFSAIILVITLVIVFLSGNPFREQKVLAAWSPLPGDVLVNGSFELNSSGNRYTFDNKALSNVPPLGWKSLPASNGFETWASGFTPGRPGDIAYGSNEDGSYLAELNANTDKGNGVYYQTVNLPTDTIYKWQASHRGRMSAAQPDTALVNIGAAANATLTTNNPVINTASGANLETSTLMSDTNRKNDAVKWSTYNGFYCPGSATVAGTASIDTTFALASKTVSSNSIGSEGNLVDSCSMVPVAAGSILTISKGVKANLNGLLKALNGADIGDMDVRGYSLIQGPAYSDVFDGETADTSSLAVGEYPVAAVVISGTDIFIVDAKIVVTATVSGKVTGLYDNGNITITYTVNGEEKSTVTGPDGKYSIEGIPPGSAVVINAPEDKDGYKPATPETGYNLPNITDNVPGCDFEFVPLKTAMTVSKTADKSTAIPGDVIHYTVTVKNTGESLLSGITPTDTMSNDHVMNLTPPAGFNGTLAAGASVIYTASYTVTAADIGKTVKNTVSVTSKETTAAGYPAVTDTAKTEILDPSMTVAKTVDKVTAVQGDVIHYTVKVTNTGELALTDLVPVDNMSNGYNLTLIPPTGFNGTLAAGASVIYTANYTVKAEDAGKTIINTVTVTSKETTQTDPTAVYKDTATTTVNTVTTVPQIEYTVIYEPGEHGAFPAQVTNNLHYGDKTPAAPAADGNPGWYFAGWSPAPEATVTGNATYVAQWFFKAPEGDNKVTLHLSKELTDGSGAKGGDGKKFAVRLYDESMNLLGRYILSANTGEVSIEKLSSGTTYYLAEEAGNGFKLLGYNAEGFESTGYGAVGIKIPILSVAENMDIYVTVKNQIIDLTDIPDTDPPLVPFTPPENPPVIGIPDKTPTQVSLPWTGDKNSPLPFITLGLSIIVPGSIAINKRRSKKSTK